MFLERGFAGASVEAIAAAAAFTRGAFYSNFESKEELFAELLQERVYKRYAEMIERDTRGRAAPQSLREVGEELAADPGERRRPVAVPALARATRPRRPRRATSARSPPASGAGTASRMAAMIEAVLRRAGCQPPPRPDRLASAMIALDIGLALQHFVDADAAPLDLYPELYELLFGPLAPR